MIRFHGGPITPNDAAEKAWRDGHACISFANPQQVQLAFEVAGEVMIDNGAYSWWRAGKGGIDINSYLGFVNHWKRHPAFGWCVIPDVIDGDEATNKSLVEMWKLPESRRWPGSAIQRNLELLG